ncbi:lipoprotein insertase outer membrane protein LolB [Ideonella sp.]|uniref:lipoprotein insertase outer membrane protein LolB n=1 Tax=Ideonella sp. TaxID=1929293 RepID=UPI0035B18A1A
MTLRGWARAVAGMIAAAVLAGCASAPPQPGTAPVLSGRLLVKVAALGDQPAQSHNAAFELSGDERQGQMRLLGPLGAQVALAHWNEHGASLQDSQGGRDFPDLATMTGEALGEPIPLAALMQWLQGRPWDGAPHRPLASATPGFVQLGWSVDLARWADDALVEATRIDPPGVVVRAKLDRTP